MSFRSFVSWTRAIAALRPNGGDWTRGAGGVSGSHKGPSMDMKGILYTDVVSYLMSLIN